MAITGAITRCGEVAEKPCERLHFQKKNRSGMRMGWVMGARKVSDYNPTTRPTYNEQVGLGGSWLSGHAEVVGLPHSEEVVIEPWLTAMWDLRWQGTQCIL